jgi:hypothetical protein
MVVMIWSYSLYEQEGRRRLFCSNGFDVSFAHDCDEAVGLTLRCGNGLRLMDVHNCKVIGLRTFRSSSLSKPYLTPHSFAGITGSTT